MEGKPNLINKIHFWWLWHLWQPPDDMSWPSGHIELEILLYCDMIDRVVKYLKCVCVCVLLVFADLGRWPPREGHTSQEPAQDALGL